MPVTTLHPQYQSHARMWERCRDCAGGSDAVKTRGTTYLPLLEGMSRTGNLAPGAGNVSGSVVGSSYAYDAYKTRALFYPAVGRTVQGLVGLIFGHPPTATGVPKSLQPEFDDVTLTGKSLLAFGIDAANEVLLTGRVGALLDRPAADNGRPYVVEYKAEQIVNHKYERIDGVQKLTLLVLRESVEVAPDDAEREFDEFNPKMITQFRVCRLAAINGARQYVVQVWRESNDTKKIWTPGVVVDGVWSPSADNEAMMPIRRGEPLPFIPFACLGPSGVSLDYEHPPLVDLADVDLSHYRTSADQEHGAHYTALPTPYVTGVTLPPGDVLTIGSGTAWVLPDAQAKAGMVEFTGAGLESLAKLKEEKRQLMATLGARMLETQKNVQEAAQTVRLRHAGESSALSIASEALGMYLSTLMRWHLWWQGVDDVAAGKAALTLNPDVMDELSHEDINALVATWQAGGISHRTLYENLQWGEWTRPNITFEQELAEIDREGPTPTPVELPPAPEPDDDGPADDDDDDDDDNDDGA